MYQFFNYLINECKEEYNDEHKKMKERQNNNMIQVDSTKAQIIADYIKDGGSID